MSFLDEKETKILLRNFWLNNVLIEKRKIKKHNNVDMLSHLPFCDELNIAKTEKSFKGYVKRYSIYMIKNKDLSMNDDQLLKTCF